MRRATLLATVVIVSLLVLASGVALAKAINGTGGNDRLVGTNSKDTISGGGGNDDITGRGGPDRLSGDSGNDKVSGGDGEDEIFGGKGRDELFGGDGDDFINSVDDKKDKDISCGRGNDDLAVVDEAELRPGNVAPPGCEEAFFIPDQPENSSLRSAAANMSESEARQAAESGNLKPIG